MIFEQLFDTKSSTYTYIISSGKGREALIIDPVIENTDEYIKVLKSLGLKLVKVIDTHIHADHITGLNELSKRTKCSKIMGEQSKSEVLDIRVKDNEKIKIENILKRKGKTPLICLTAYSSPIAEILDKYCDIILVGDSVGMVLYGMNTTKKVKFETMILHAKAVKDSTKRSLVVFDMPRNTYSNKFLAYKNAKRAMKLTKCDAIKIEGGKKIFNKCKACHFIDKEKNKVGPHLVKIFGRKAAVIEGFKYSNAFSFSNIGRYPNLSTASLLRPVLFKSGLIFNLGSLNII